MSSSEFAAFVGEWLLRQEALHDELLAAREHAGEGGFSDPEDLVSRVISHYKDYFDHKAVLRESDCFALFTPTWFSDLETCFLWIAGFKPALAFAIVKEAVRGLTEEQSKMMEMLQGETATGETKVEDQLARVQESVSDEEFSMAIRRWWREEITRNMCSFLYFVLF